MPISPKRLPITEHLRELRYRLTVIIAVLFLGTLALYIPAPMFFRFVLDPIVHIFEGQDLVLLNPFESFTLRFKTAFFAALTIGSPIVIWQVMAFFLPALKPKERKWLVPTFMAMVALFLTGITFAYTIILPTAFVWLARQVWEGIAQMPQAGTYFMGAIILIMGFGLAFQLPVIVFYLLIFNVVPYDTLRKNWRVVYTVLAVLAAMFTPPDPVTMLAFAGALVVLYELTLALGRVVLAKRIARQKELGY